MDWHLGAGLACALYGVVAGLFVLSFLTQGRRATRSLPDVVEELEHPHEFPPDANGDAEMTGHDATGHDATGHGPPPG